MNSAKDNGKVIKVCFYGPESTGKTTMAEEMARRFHTVFVPEVSRELIDSNDFTLDDIEKIGIEQTRRILEAEKQTDQLLICDTDILTTRIYSLHYLGAAPALLDSLEKQVRFDRYYLFHTDVPWVSDGLRDLGDRRDYMMAWFRRELQQRGITPVEVTGDYTRRTRIIEDDLRRLIRGD